MPLVSGGSVEMQAARLGDPGWQDAQRRTLANQIGQAQGNRHVQRVVGALQVMRQAKKVYNKGEVKQVLDAILGWEWTNQSAGKKPIQLTPTLIAAIRLVTNLSTEEIKLLWRTPPKGPGAALRQLNHSLLATVPASTMQKLEQIKFSLAMFGARSQGTQKGAPVPQKEAAILSGVEGKEKLFKAIVAALKGTKPEEKSQGTEALKKAVEGFFGTETGKKVKEKGLELLLSKKGLPFALLVGSAVLAGMVANNTDIPSTPEIPLADNLSIKVEFEGPFQKPKAVKFVLKFSFGGPAKAEGVEKKPAVLALPKELHAYIDRIDRNMLIKWFQQRAFDEWESAGPDWEERKLKFYQAARDRPHALGLPDTRLAAEALSRVLVEAAIQNRIHQLKGEEIVKRIEFDLGHEGQWDQFLSLEGLSPRLAWLLNLLVPKVPYEALGIEQMTFKCGKRLIPVKVKR